MTHRVSEATASRTVQYVEDCLIRSKKLPAGEGLNCDVVILDVTEIAVQRPKKTEEKL